MAMISHEIKIPQQRIKYALGLILTLCIIHFIESSALVTIILLPVWFFLFRPLNRSEIFIFCIASLFFLGQNYGVLKAGGFSFRQQDILLMPYYEPFLWGFYYLTLKRFIMEKAGAPPLQKKAILGLIVTSLAFSLFSFSSNALLLATITSTAILLIMFHERYDLYYAALALALGCIIELFGVTTGLWSYPESDFLGIPYWFATMWISVGTFGQTFSYPPGRMAGCKNSGGKTIINFSKCS